MQFSAQERAGRARRPQWLLARAVRSGPRCCDVPMPIRLRLLVLFVQLRDTCDLAAHADEVLQNCRALVSHQVIFDGEHRHHLDNARADSLTALFLGPLSEFLPSAVSSSPLPPASLSVLTGLPREICTRNQRKDGLRKLIPGGFSVSLQLYTKLSLQLLS